MTPRWYFVLRGILWGILTVICALVAVYFLSFVLFALRESGVLFAPMYGWAGFILFIVASPWILIGLVLLFMMVLYALVSRYAFSYQKPLLYSLLGVVLGVIFLSSLLYRADFHRQANTFTQLHKVPGLTSFYAGVGSEQPKNMARGTVLDFVPLGFVMTNPSGDMMEVIVSERTIVPRGTVIRVGDTVLVFGPKYGMTIRAFGLRLDEGRCCREME